MFEPTYHPFCLENNITDEKRLLVLLDYLKDTSPEFTGRWFAYLETFINNTAWEI